MDARRDRASVLMAQFAERTGLTSTRLPERYLWTDAFAVCNFLGLARATGERPFDELALRLVSQVHRVLGRYRIDDVRSGWISGLPADEGEAHPTRGGLRIGKPLPERHPGAPVDERLEWDRDGQYFHYLTKWMLALDQVARSTREPMFNEWARELATAAHRAFTYAPPEGGRKMYWKLSTDLSRPLVASMGQHDPLDGLVTYCQIEAFASGSEPRLGAAIADFAAMIQPERLATGDPLGLGSLLADAYRATQSSRHVDGLVETLLSAALAGLRFYTGQRDLQLSAEHRLAFRELGLAIGLAALEGDAWRVANGRLRSLLDELSRYAPLRHQIEHFWLQPEHRRADTWLDHANINDVMLATSLRPEGFLVVHTAPPR